MKTKQVYRDEAGRTWTRTGGECPECEWPLLTVEDVRGEICARTGDARGWCMDHRSTRATPRIGPDGWFRQVRRALRETGPRAGGAT